jgi:hypothetical protein
MGLIAQLLFFPSNPLFLSTLVLLEMCLFVPIKQPRKSVFHAPSPVMSSRIFRMDDWYALEELHDEYL